MLKIYCISCFLWLSFSFNGFCEDGKDRVGKSSSTQTKEATGDTPPKSDYQYEVSGLTVSYETSKTKTDTTDFEWEMGDNTTIQSQQKVVHTFQNLGSYETCLTVNNPLAKEKLIKEKNCKVISIGDPYLCEPDWIPVCGSDNQTYMNSCYAENYHGVYYWEEGPCSEIDYSLTASFIYENRENGSVQFINTSEGNFETYVWDFGNGENTKARNPQVIFHVAGTYNVCLTVSSQVTQMKQTYCEEIEVASNQ